MACAAVFSAHGSTSLWHYTNLDGACGIIEHGAIYARAELRRRGIAFPESHYFGNEEKEAILGEYVSCSHMPPWGMMQNERQEIVVMALNVGACDAEGTCFCPGYSARAEYISTDIVTWTEDEHLERLYTGTGYATVQGAEIFVPTVISGDHTTKLCFFNQAMLDAHLPRLIEAGKHSRHAYTHTINVTVEPSRFPRQWKDFGAPWEDTNE